jgi:hypothetical protein
MDRFFTSYEILLSTLHLVDELSLVRLQRVNRTFRKVITESSTLMNRLGMRTSNAKATTKTKVLKTRRVEEIQTEVFWNPLLNWFEFGCFKEEWDSRGILRDCEGITMLTLLPHTLRAVREEVSSIYGAHVTTTPVDKVVLVCVEQFCPDKEVKKMLISDNKGVTLGAVFKAWVDITPAHLLGLPCVLCVPFGSCDLHLEYGTRFALLHMLDRIDMRLNMPFTNPILRPGEKEDICATVVRMGNEWFRHTVTGGEAWYETEMGEQVRHVKSVLREMKRVWEAPEWTVRADKGICRMPCSVAMAFRDGEEDVGGKVLSEMRFEVEFVAGVVLNRMRWDAGKILI